MKQRLEKALPPNLLALHAWVCWRAEERDGKQTKVPYSPHGGMAKSNDPRTWGTFEEACYTAARRSMSGVGVVLVDDWVGYDLDVKGDPEREKIAQEFLTEAALNCAYNEVSPSGKGYRVFTRGLLPRAGKGGEGNWIEAYDKTSPRYLTVTGNTVTVVEGKIEPAQRLIDWAHARFFSKEKAISLPLPSPRQVSLTDAELIEKMRQVSREFDRLYAGMAGNDHSAADLALCNILAWWTNRDAAQMDRIFRSSGLMREKWNKRHHADGRTYGEATIDKAIAGCVGGYDPSYRSSEQKAEKKTEQKIEKTTEWKELLQQRYDKEGKPLGLKRNAYNLGVILAHDERLGCFGHDEFCDRVGFTAPPPWNDSHGAVVGVSGKWWDNADYARLQFWLAAEYGVDWGRDQIAESMKMVATSRRFHPVRDWLNGLTWDGTKRLDSWLSLFLGAAPSSYTSLVGRLWLISAVARVMQPGCKADHVLILEGAQGLKKSTALRLLSTINGQAWFNDTNMHLATKDSYVALRGSWIVELAELQQLIRAETEDAKAFFTSCIDRYRPPYERDIQDYPRQCVFAGTVNEERYLRDATGNRRYWPVKVTQIDLAKVEAEKAQLWAEAVAAFRGGAVWWPEGEEQIALCTGEQAERQIGDAWESLVYDFLDTSTRNRLTATEILKGALGMDAEKVSRREEMRLAKIIEPLDDWKKTRWLSNQRKISGYERLGGHGQT